MSQTRQLTLASTLATCVLACLLVGCSEPKAKLVPAKGTITIKGKPAANISIQFLPDVTESTEGVWPSSMAVSKEDGSFELMTVDNQAGACLGKHKIILVDAEEERVAQGEQRTKPIRLDPSYSVAGKLTAVVEEGKSIELVVP